MPGRARPTTKRLGRPPGGARPGEKVLDYPQVSMRLPPDCRDTLRELASATHQPQWRIVADALAEHVERLPLDVRRRVRLAVARSVVGRKRKGSRL